MTFAIAWHDGRRLYIVADSAYSSSGDAKETVSTVGEAPHKRGTRSAEERRMKVVRLSAVCVGTLCGNVYSAEQFLLRLESLMGSNPPARSFFEAIATLASEPPTRAFAIMIGFWNGTRTQILRFDTSDLHQVWAAPEGSGMHIGSMPPGFLPDIQGICATSLLHTATDPVHPLVVGLAYLQHLGATEYLLQHGIGGVFLGAYVDASGLRWQPDVRYMFYDPNASRDQLVLSEAVPDEAQYVPGTSFVAVVSRAGGAAIQSSFWGNRIRVMTTYASGPWDAYASRWKQEIEHALDCDTARFFVALSMTSKQITIVDRATATELVRWVPGKGAILSGYLHRKLVGHVGTDGWIEVIG